MHSGRTRNQGSAQHWQKVTNGAYILSEIEKEVKSVVNWWVTENGRSGQENLDNKSFLEVREWDIQKDWGCLGRVSNFRRGTLPRVKVRLLMCMAHVKAMAGEDPDHLGWALCALEHWGALKEWSMICRVLFVIFFVSNLMFSERSSLTEVVLFL